MACRYSWAMQGPLTSVASIILGIFLLQAGNGLLGSYLSLRLALEHLPAPLIGMVVTGFPLGFLGGCLFGPRLIREIGHIRTFAVLASAYSCATLVLAFHVEPFFWTAVRLLSGFAAAGLFMVGESWLNDRTPRELRGRIFGIYTTSNMTAVSASQLLLSAGDPLGLQLFMAAAGFICASLIPIATTRTSVPELTRSRPLNVFELYRLSPVAVIGCIAAGLGNTALGGIGPLFASEAGLSAGEVGRFMAALLFGGLLLQWPIGRLSDLFDRRTVLLCLGIAAAGMAAMLALFAGRMGAGLYLAILIYGGLVYTVYPVCVAHANDFADRTQVVAVSSGLLLSWAVGSIAGPSLATATMSVVGPAGLFLYTGTVAALLATFTLWRMTRGRVPSRRRGFVSKAPTSPVAAELDPRADELPASVRARLD